MNKTIKLDQIRQRLNEMQAACEGAIMNTPSGEFRNGLTEINMALMAAETTLRQNGLAALGMFPFPKAEQPEPAPFPFTEEEEYEGLNRMKLMGGSFAKAIAAAWFAADLNNRQKLRTQFASLLQPYVELYRNGQ